jgi:3-oxoacyl-[acyl-carrier-protein] synthase-3
LTAAPKAVSEVLNKQEWTASDVDTFAFHQANQFIVQYLARKMHLPTIKVPVSVADVGNTGPASIPLMLSREGHSLASADRLKKVVLCGFGVGLSWGAAALSLSKTKFVPMREY